VRMRAFSTLLLLVACHEAAPPAAPSAPVTAPVAAVAVKPRRAPAAPAAERLATDTARTTVEGATFIAPAGWTITVRGPATILDMDQGVAEKRASQVGLIVGRLLPRDYQRETFAGKTARRLDAERLAQLSAFIEAARDSLGVPAIALGIVQDGKVVFADGF